MTTVLNDPKLESEKLSEPEFELLPQEVVETRGVLKNLVKPFGYFHNIKSVEATRYSLGDTTCPKYCWMEYDDGSKEYGRDGIEHDD
jgi:hypothetical protein